MKAPPTTLSAASAISYCATSPAAVVLTVWPSGTLCLDRVYEWLESSGAEILHSSTVPLSTPISELLSIMALYDGEDWLESNCWYAEQPLPDGPPSGPYAGAQWKRALCFRNADRQPQAVVVDASAASSLWRSKYTIRSELARVSGNPGNSCIHLTDEQDEATLARYREGGGRSLAGGMACDDSYAYACARALLHPASVKWLNSGANGLAEPAQLGGDDFRAAWSRYTSWLQAPPRPPALGSCHGRAPDEFDEAPSFMP